MRRMILFAALIPVLALAAACSGAGAPPGTVSLTSTDPYGDVAGGVTQMDNPGCRSIVDVEVVITPAMNVAMVELNARYRYQPTNSLCGVPPTWWASRPGLIVHPKDPFRASIERHAGVRTSVTATAPNGKVGRMSF